ncbi:CHASE2 domain-containing protein [Lusitaniella coriacea]|uniref:CHASE2 domain-containing protein n=1 Tax=Lusitaniella coriacea TaxID=1983105 RepID=UPI003CF7BF72
MWQKLKHKIGEWRGILTIASSVAGLTIAGSAIGVFQLLEWATIDRLFQLRPAEPVDSRIVIVTIDEPDIQYLGEWPMSDRDMASVLKKIAAQQPKAIGIDIYRDLPVEPGHEELVEVFKSTPNLIAIEKVGGETVAPPPALEKTDRIAAADMVIDADGKVRRGLIGLGTKEGAWREGLGAKLALTYLEEAELSLETLDEEKQIYQLGEAVFVPLQGDESLYVGREGFTGGIPLTLGEIAAQVKQWWKGNAGGYQIILNYRGQIDRFHHISLTDVQENKIPPDLMRDRVVFLGVTTPSLKDVFPTPYTNTFLATPVPTPGVVIHANLASQMMSGSLDGRPMLYAWDRTANWLWIVLWSFIGSVGSWSILQTKLVNKNIFFLGTLSYVVLASCLLVGGGYFSFLAGWVIPLFSPFFALSASAILAANYYNQWQLKQANEQLENYSRTLEFRVAERTKALSQALEDLKATQDELIQKEKMAALGQLVAGVAHEVNTPLGAIRSSISNIDSFLKDRLEALPDFFRTLSSERQKDFFNLLQYTEEKTAPHLSFRERRKIKRRFIAQLDDEEIPDADILADTLVDIGVLDALEPLLPLLRDPDRENILDIAYQLTSLQRNARTISNATDRAAKVVFALKTYSHYDASGNKVKTNVVEGIETVLTLYTTQLKQRVEVLREYDEEIPIIWGYSDELNQVWTNLLHNAIQAMDNKGELKIGVKCKQDNLEITFTDNGQGIPTEIQDKIFQPFFTTKPPGEGSGLGLDIVRKILEKHQGTIDFQSVPGETTFRVTLPINSGEEMLVPA